MIRRFFRRISPKQGVPYSGDLDTAAVERVTGQTLLNIALYEKALTHRSLLRSNPDSLRESNERLEFLGDAILGMVVAANTIRRMSLWSEAIAVARILRRVFFGDLSGALEPGRPSWGTTAGRNIRQAGFAWRDGRFQDT